MSKLTRASLPFMDLYYSLQYVQLIWWGAISGVSGFDWVDCRIFLVITTPSGNRDITLSRNGATWTFVHFRDPGSGVWLLWPEPRRTPTKTRYIPCLSGVLAYTVQAVLDTVCTLYPVLWVINTECSSIVLNLTQGKSRPGKLGHNSLLLTGEAWAPMG